MDWKKAFNPPFIAATIVLVVALVGLQSVVHAFQLFLMKQPIPLRQKLFMISPDLGDYHKVYEQHLTREIIEELGTEQYLSWNFQDTRLKQGEPGSEILLHVAYYTGTPDSTPHVPERCFVAAGAAPGKAEVQDLLLTPSRVYHSGGRIIVTRDNGQEVLMPTLEIPARIFDFKPTESAESSVVLYFFSCNGKLLSSPKQVSSQILDVRSRYAYWCKIEVQPRHVSDRAQAAEIARQFLSQAMPEIQACLPDWVEVQAGRYPDQTGH